MRRTLEEMEERHKEATRGYCYHDWEKCVHDVPDLIAEVRRLQAEEKRLRKLCKECPYGRIA
ncbi:unnamed protein product [marine sediment metagenome]|uniref:Uncharacterized protein n=1 Tax=marine sediment metagenome TaxID=412755 RepID=X1ALZ5_9ZZZZ